MPFAGNSDSNRHLDSRFSLKEALEDLLQMFLVLCPSLLAGYFGSKFLDLTIAHSEKLNPPSNMQLGPACTTTACMVHLISMKLGAIVLEDCLQDGKPINVTGHDRSSHGKTA